MTSIRRTEGSWKGTCAITVQFMIRHIWQAPQPRIGVSGAQIARREGWMVLQGWRSRAQSVFGARPLMIVAV